MTNTLFVSDLHLSEETEHIEQGFYRFLNNECEISRLFLLGDIFEAWIGDDDNSDLAKRFADALTARAQRGTRIFFTPGNRDFLLGAEYLSQFGGTRLEDEVCVPVAGSQALLMHGDTLCTDDTDYLKFRALVHSPQWQAEMLSKPLPERRELARQLRATSREAASNKAEDIMDVNDLAVEEALQRHCVTRLIHGHTHRPQRHRLADAERIVLGDWTSTGWCLRDDGATLALEQFPV